MTATQCVRCERPMADQAWACSSCGSRAGDQLNDIADMTPAARDIATGQSHRAGGSGGSGKPGSRLPFDLGATSKLDAVQGELITWARHVTETRGIHGPGIHGDPIARFATWLGGHVEWMRHRQEADEFLAAVDSCLRVVRSIARGPAEQKYLGPCGADRKHADLCGETVCYEDDFTLNCTCWCHTDEPSTCEGDVYAYRGSRVGRCRTCGAEVATGDREAWLDGEVRSHAFRAAQIAEAYGVNANTIRSWAARGQLVPHGHDPEDRPLFNVGEVLDLAAADAARRATEQAKRARRRERAAETEDERMSA